MGDPRFDALEVASQILAGGKGSRLYRRLVREDRIAQDVSFFALGLIGGASIAAGQATVVPGVDPAVVEAAFEEELELLGREPVTDDELARARDAIRSLTALAPETAEVSRPATTRPDSPVGRKWLM